jgi:gas vesicle protein
VLEGHERDNHEAGGAGFIVGLLTGAVLGVGLGMLLAPKPGSDLRGELGEQAKTVGAKASERYQRASETATVLAERGREIVNQAREAVNRGAEEARSAAGDGSGATGAADSFGASSASGDGDVGRA